MGGETELLYKPSPWVNRKRNAPADRHVKHHRVADHVFSAADTWEDVVFDATPALENTGGTLIQSDGKTIQPKYSGMAQISGCIRPKWTGGTAGVALVAVRVVSSVDNGGTWTEHRCLQGLSSRNRQASEMGVVPLIGSIYITPSTIIKMQAQTSDIELQLVGWDGFDYPVSATINMFAV